MAYRNYTRMATNKAPDFGRYTAGNCKNYATQQSFNEIAECGAQHETTVPEAAHLQIYCSIPKFSPTILKLLEASPQSTLHLLDACI